MSVRVVFNFFELKIVSRTNCKRKLLDTIPHTSESLEVTTFIQLMH